MTDLEVARRCVTIAQQIAQSGSGWTWDAKGDGKKSFAVVSTHSTRKGVVKAAFKRLVTTIKEVNPGVVIDVYEGFYGIDIAINFPETPASCL